MGVATMSASLKRLVSWEGLLLLVLLVVMAFNAIQTPFYLRLDNQVNLFQLSIEKIIVVLVMAFVIINGEIDLSVASVMGLAACVVAVMKEAGVPVEWAIVCALLVGLAAGAFNGFMVAFVGLPSLIVTLAGLIGYRGFARVLVEDNSVTGFPDWFNHLGQQPLLGPLPLALVLFFVMAAGATVILHFSGFGRRVYVIGNSARVARYSGVNVQRMKMTLFMASGLVAALAGVLFAMRLGAVRGDIALGFELDVITMVLLGGVSIFGGSGSMYGVLLAVLIILNVRNGMGLLNISGNTQTGVIGLLLILSVLVPNAVREARAIWRRRRYVRAVAPSDGQKGGPVAQDT
jgi:rhamnose transport system permease protein